MRSLCRLGLPRTPVAADLRGRGVRLLAAAFDGVEGTNAIVWGSDDIVSANSVTVVTRISFQSKNTCCSFHTR